MLYLGLLMGNDYAMETDLMDQPEKIVQHSATSIEWAGERYMGKFNDGVQNVRQFHAKGNKKDGGPNRNFGRDSGSILEELTDDMRLSRNNGWYIVPTKEKHSRKIEAMNFEIYPRHINSTIYGYLCRQHT